MVGVSTNTVVKMLIDVGKASAKHQHEFMRNLACCKLQMDETRSFVHAKDRNLPESMVGQHGKGSNWTLVRD